MFLPIFTKNTTFKGYYAMKKSLLFSILIVMSVCLAAQPKVVGHRGCRFDGPFENTLEAMRLAQEAGVDAIEFDVQLTSDGEVIVFHGPAVPGAGKDIRDMNFADARAIVLPGGHKMPTLEEWLEAGRQYPGIKLVMEIKKQRSREKDLALTRKAMCIVKQVGMESQLEYTSFEEIICNEVHAIAPQAKIIYLQSGTIVHDAAWAAQRGYNGISYNLDGFLNNPGIVEQAKALGIETTLWLVNDFEVADWAVRHGIDYISSDHPEKLVPYIRAIKAYR